MEELEQTVVSLFSQEHQDWVKRIQEAEEKNTGIDLNLGGQFAARMEKLLEAFRNFRGRSKKKKGMFK